jgi:hypothetical protein
MPWDSGDEPRTCAPQGSGGCDERHSGRIQVQGTGLSRQDSRPWSQNSPPTVSQGLAMADDLQAQLPRRDARLLDQAFDKARNYIRHCAPMGCPRDSQTFTNRGIRGKFARVDIEIIVGIAFK